MYPQSRGGILGFGWKCKEILNFFSRIPFVLVWMKRFSDYYTGFVGLSKWISVLLLLRARVPTVDEGKYKYGKGARREGRIILRWIAVRSSLWIYGINTTSVCCKANRETPVATSTCRTYTPLYHSPWKIKQESSDNLPIYGLEQGRLSLE